ncbi:cytochrome c1 [Robbsia sp. Bb-Pol-6]|uniref:Cytochrome c1 n=1 Tax=Robbsia betulipollinis TaxID=2981849 RepID=A0ABT3ZR53_9BURK|nr:cytochrome c1 [Robbsia betulipollinis]MCY0388368.1 cytochrome c1 [Robbsia betulipollinis]
MEIDRLGVREWEGLPARAARSTFANLAAATGRAALRVLLTLACALLAVVLLGQVRHARAADFVPVAPIPLVTPPDRSADRASLQRGARLFAGYCASCHAARLVRYGQLRELGFSNADIVAELDPTAAKLDEPLHAAMRAEDAKQAFGIAPPDLSLVARAKGRAWIYTYLRSFYSDPDRPMGANNLLVPDVAMPDVLAGLHGERTAVFAGQDVAGAQAGAGRHSANGAASGAVSAAVAGSVAPTRVFVRFAQGAPGSLSPAAYDSALADLTAYLGWMAEPAERQRHRLGAMVVGFLLLFSFAAWRLLRSYRPADR